MRLFCKRCNKPMGTVGSCKLRKHLVVLCTECWNVVDCADKMARAVPNRAADMMKDLFGMDD